jgi:FkbM family methyltransferase
LWVATEVLLEKVYDLSLVPFTPDLIYDFGANIGLFSLIAANRWPDAKLICVEPHPVTFHYLATNLHINCIPASMLQCAVDAAVGIKFLRNKGSVFQELSEKETDTFTLCIKMDSLMEFSSKQRILIKMDIEESEEAVLNALSINLPSNCFIFIELHRGDSSIAWIQKWSMQRGFQFVEVRRRDLAIDGYLVR